MPASSKDAVRRAEQPLASAGNTDGAILPGVYEGFGEALKLFAQGTTLYTEQVKASIRIELGVYGTFVHTLTVDGTPTIMKGVYGVTTAGVDLTPEGKKHILDPSRERGISMPGWHWQCTHSERGASAVTALHSLPRQTTV